MGFVFLNLMCFRVVGSLHICCECDYGVFILEIGQCDLTEMAHIALFHFCFNITRPAHTKLVSPAQCPSTIFFALCGYSFIF